MIDDIDLARAGGGSQSPTFKNFPKFKIAKFRNKSPKPEIGIGVDNHDIQVAEGKKNKMRMVSLTDDVYDPDFVGLDDIDMQRAKSPPAWYEAFKNHLHKE